MSDTLRGCFEKVKRAQLHIEALEDGIKVFLAEQPYPLVLKAHSYYSNEALEKLGVPTAPPSLPEISPDLFGEPPRYVRDVGVRLGQVIEANTLLWGLLVGDSIHNLRCALDHLVWGLAIAHSGTPPLDPIPRNSCWRDVAFPIVGKETDWHSGLNKLVLIDPQLTTRFKRLQPFYRRKHPERHPLKILEALWNIDKHRYVPVVATLMRFEKLGTPPPDFPQPLNIELLRRRGIGPLHPNAELATLRVQPPFLVNKEALEMYMNMNTAFTFDIAFEKGPPAYGWRVLKTLKRLTDTVTAIIVKFEAVLP